MNKTLVILASIPFVVSGLIVAVQVIASARETRRMRELLDDAVCQPESVTSAWIDDSRGEGDDERLHIRFENGEHHTVARDFDIAAAKELLAAVGISVEELRVEQPVTLPLAA